MTDTDEQAIEAAARAAREVEFAQGHCDDLCAWWSYVPAIRAAIEAYEAHKARAGKRQ